MKSKLTYHKAYMELTKLVEEIEDESIQLDTLAEKVKQATELINFCEKKLRIIESETNNLKSE